ncbi:cupin domain-containing protein [Ideonella sp.]|uniref:cupin domain-containing protein n=1 Tax=Ideonella sp. TaxID=1929293 RepID=UPI0035B27E08
MSLSTTHSSGDFAKVPAALDATLPDRLLHADVTGNTPVGDRDFSHERRHQVNVVDLPSKVISMTVGGLEPGQSTRKHRHNYETLIYVLEGEGKSIIGEREVAWKRGDAFYVPVWAWHQHINLSPQHKATYLACENAPHLQNLGVALREEA